MNSTLQIDLPVCVWFLIVGAAISFLLGYFQVEKLEVGLNGRLYRRVRYGDQFAMMNAAAFGAMTVLMWLKFSVKIPRLMLFKIGLFGVAVLAMIGLFVLFWGIAFTATTMAENVKTKHTR